MQFSSAALESEAAWLGPRRAVFPSQLWDGPAPLPLRRLDRVVIGWGGSAAHREDLQAVIPAIASVLDRHPEARLAIMSDESVRPVLDPLPADRVSFTPWGSLGAYYKFLEGIDVGIAPLSPTPYNRCRSDVRFVEYAAHGVLAVCADLEPYREAVRAGQTGYLYRDTAELETVLERALAEGEVRAAIPARAARQVGSERLERRHAAGRLGFYLAVAAENGIELPGPSSARLFPPAAVADPAAAARTFVGSRYFALGDGEVEGLLTAALDHARAGAVDDARRTLAAAARLAPQSYLPPLLLAKIETPAAALEALARAATLNADPARSRICKASTFWRSVTARAPPPRSSAPAPSPPPSARRRNGWAPWRRRPVASTKPADSTKKPLCTTAASPSPSPDWQPLPNATGRSTRPWDCWSAACKTIPISHSRTS